jgi:hypothetical protein
MKRRTLLKIMLGTAPAVTVFGLQRAMWPQDQVQRPQNDPVAIGIDNNGHLYDPGHTKARPTRRVFYGLADMTRRDRYDFYRGHLGEQTLQSFLRGDEEDAEDVKLSFARLDEIDNRFADYFADEPEPEEGTFRDRLEHSRYWIGAWLHDNLPAEALQRLNLAYVEGDQPEGAFYAVRYTGSLEQINSALFESGLNAVCYRVS